MRKHLVKHLEENNALPDSQHGFRRSRSCLTQLIEHVDTVLRSFNEGNEVDVIYLDYSKPFDKVDHRLLLKLYGISRNVYNWLESFLTGRQQTVVVEGAKSSFQAVTSGVPQGTVLGPILFILYVIEMVLKVRNSKPLTFADDSKLTKVIIDLLQSITAGRFDQCHSMVYRKQHAAASRQICCDKLLSQHLETTPGAAIHCRDPVVLYNRG